MQVFSGNEQKIHVFVVAPDDSIEKGDARLSLYGAKAWIQAVHQPAALRFLRALPSQQHTLLLDVLSLVQA